MKVKQWIDPAGGGAQGRRRTRRLPEAVSSRLLPNARARVDATLPEDVKRGEASVDGLCSRPYPEQAAAPPLGGAMTRRELQRGARVHGLLPRLASITTLAKLLAVDERLSLA